MNPNAAHDPSTSESPFPGGHMRMIGLGRSISGALSRATGEQPPLVLATDQRLTLHMTEAQSQHLLAKLTEAT